MNDNNNGDKPAFATPTTVDKQGRVIWGANDLTKREYIATHIMTGSLVNPAELDLKELAEYAVLGTDALLAALSQSDTTQK